MLLAIVFVNIWGVLQLVALGSLARTVRIRTVLAAVTVGLFFCAPLAAALEYAWMVPIAAVTGYPLEQLVAVGGYTVDPAIEEIVRILPLAMLMVLPSVRHQWSVTDFVLIAAAAGAGFGLAEDLFRFGAAAQYARGIHGGWVVPFQSWAGGAVVTSFVPAVTTTLGSWLPDIGGVRMFPPSGIILPNLLLMWSALAGLGVGLFFRLKGPRRWYAALALLAFVSADHAAVNADITLGPQALTSPLRAFRDLLPYLPAVALAIAWWVDRERQTQILPDHRLASEQQGSPRVVGVLRASLTRLPHSMFWVERFVRLRRAYDIQRFSGDEADDLRVAIREVRDQIEGRLQQPGGWNAATRAWVDEVRRLLRQRRLIVGIILALPSVLWLIVGGWPATAGVQRLVSTGVGFGMIATIAIVAQVWMALGIASSLRSWRSVRRLPIGDPAATWMLAIVAGIGTLGFGVYTLLRPLLFPIAGTAHASDALGSMPWWQFVPFGNLGAALADWLRRVSNMQIPVPFTADKYVTPEAGWKAGINAGIRMGVRHGLGAVLGPALEIAQRVPQWNVGKSDDPNNLNRYYEPIASMLTEMIFGAAVGAGGGGRTPGRTPPAVDPVAKTEPAIDALANTERQMTSPVGRSTPGIDPLAKTEPQMHSPLATTQPNVDPLATTQPQTTSPLASTQPGAPHAGQGSPQPQPPTVQEMEAAMNAARDEWTQAIRDKMEYLTNRPGSAFSYEGDPAKWDPRTSEELSRRMWEAQRTYDQRVADWLEARRTGGGDP